MADSDFKIVDEDPTVKLHLKGHKKTVTDIAFNPNKKQFASSSEDHNIMVWNVIQNARSYNFTGHTDIVNGLDYTSDGKVLASCSKDNSVIFWTPSITGGSVQFKAHTSNVFSLKFSPDDEHLLTSSADKSLKIWDSNSRQFISSLKGHNNWVRFAKYSNDGQLIGSCADDHTTKIWDTATNRCEFTFSTKSLKTFESDTPSYVSFHRNDKTIAVALHSGVINLYDLRTNKLRQHYQLHDNTTCVEWHPLAQYLITCGEDGKICIVDVMEGRPVYTLTGHIGRISRVKFNGSGDCFASGGSDKRIQLWNTNFIS